MPGRQMRTDLTRSHQMSVRQAKRPEWRCSRGGEPRGAQLIRRFGGSSITDRFTIPSRLDVDLQGQTNPSTYMFMLETPPGFDICPIDSAAVVSPFLARRNARWSKKNQCLSKSLKVVNVGIAVNIQLSMRLILFVHQLPLGVVNSVGCLRPLSGLVLV